jgi:hypothetical protein
MPSPRHCDVKAITSCELDLLGTYLEMLREAYMLPKRVIPQHWEKRGRVSVHRFISPQFDAMGYCL